MKYYYFHGYGSSPSACKAEAMREILGAENVSAPDFNVSVEEVSDGNINPAPLISARFAFENYIEAYKYIDDNRTTAMKVMIDMDL